MSKASEWLKLETCSVAASHGGGIHISGPNGGAWIKKDEVLSLAHWIIDVFGEPEQGGRE